MKKIACKIAVVIAGTLAAVLVMPAGVTASDRLSGPSGPEQSAHWTPAQAQIYANKLQGLAEVQKTFGFPAVHPYIPLGLPKANLTLPLGPPASASITILNDPEPDSYYGYQCGPAAGHNALYAYGGINVPIGTLSPATDLTLEMHTTTAGTARGNMPGPLYSHQTLNTHIWQTLGSPPGSTNGTTDLKTYTTQDIWYGDPPIYNIETYGLDPIQNKWRWPFVQYDQVDIQHYVAAYAYTSSGNYISISDSAVKNSHTLAQRYTQGYLDVWAAIHNHPAIDAVLW